MDARTVARAGLFAALLAVSAMVTIPVGVVPFTLQTLALSVLPAVADRKTSLLAVGTYILLGALGLPVFSGFSGGLGVLFGPTGGFLWGFIVGVAIATTLVPVLPRRIPRFVRVIAADAVLLLVSYACGTVQLMLVGSMGVISALGIAVLPFLVPDAVKVVVGARIGCSVARATVRPTAMADFR